MRFVRFLRLGKKVVDLWIKTFDRKLEKKFFIKTLREKKFKPRCRFAFHGFFSSFIFFRNFNENGIYFSQKKD